MKVNGLALGVGIFEFVTIQFMFDMYLVKPNNLFLFSAIFIGLLGILNFYLAFKESEWKR